MKRLLLLICLCISRFAIAQHTAEYKVDDNLAILLPENYVKHDTLGLQAITATLDSAQILVLIRPFDNVKDLEESYRGMADEAVNQSHGRLIKQEVVDKDKLKINTFTIEVAVNGRPCMVGFAGLILNNKMCVVQLGRQDGLPPSQADMLKMLKLSGDVSLENQQSKIESKIDRGELDDVRMDKAERQYNIGQLIGQYIIGPLLLVGLIVVIVRYFRKRAAS